MDNRRNVDFRAQAEVRYADVKNEEITVMVRITGGKCSYWSSYAGFYQRNVLLPDKLYSW